MDSGVWLAFVSASIVVLIIPGPTIFFIISLALKNGKKNALSASLGVALGDLVAISLALVGVGVLMSMSLLFFTLLKIVGSFYLIYLGYTVIKNKAKNKYDYIHSDDSENLRSFFKVMLITLLNPKSILFFIAFIPLFINEDRSYISQVSIIIPTFVALGFINALVYFFTVSFLKDNFLSDKLLGRIDKIAGGLLIAFGATLLGYNKDQ